MKSFVSFLIREEEEEKKKDDPVSQEIDTESTEEPTEPEEEELFGGYGSREITSDAADIIKSLRMK